MQMLYLTEGSRFMLMNVVVFNGADGFDNLKGGFGISSCGQAEIYQPSVLIYCPPKVTPLAAYMGIAFIKVPSLFLPITVIDLVLGSPGAKFHKLAIDSGTIDSDVAL